ncbi:hypothetical protein NC652_033193 [Populus alba x Populus x berolinensis]|nr:hypothetical protein NC652_033193 [Populus alba x Populus x berolinensis]
MDDLPKVLYGWSWEENKLFEMALAVVGEEDPDRWKVVAAMVGGKKSEEDVQKHYVILLEDLQGIESGKLDHKLVGEAQPCVQVDCTESVCWTDEDHKENVVVIPLLSTKGSLVSKLLQKNASGSCFLLSEGSDFRLMHFHSQSHEKDNTVHFCGGFSNVAGTTGHKLIARPREDCKPRTSLMMVGVLILKLYT